MGRGKQVALSGQPFTESSSGENVRNSRICFFSLNVENELSQPPYLSVEALFSFFYFVFLIEIRQLTCLLEFTASVV